MREFPLHLQQFIERFVLACQADERVAAAFLGGSYAREAADAYSDLDLYLVTTDEDFDAFLAGKRDFLQRLGTPLFMEDFDISDALFFILEDGTEGELGFGRQSHFEHIHSGPYRPLLDKEGLLDGVFFQSQVFTRADRMEALRRQIYWFWHDLSHFITALGRGKLWWAYCQLEILRGICMNLMRLYRDFYDPDVGDEPGFKIEQAVLPGQLAAFYPTYCPLQADALLQSVSALIQIYRNLAQPLARQHGIEYPEALEGLLLERLEKLHKIAHK